MANESPELIEQQMHQTRQSLTEKVAALENQVVGTVQSAASAVQETVESVKSVVTDTVSTVKETVGDVKDTVEGTLLNVAVTATSVVNATLQVAVPEQPPPLHPVNVDPAEGVAESATTVPPG